MTSSTMRLIPIAAVWLSIAACNDNTRSMDGTANTSDSGMSSAKPANADAAATASNIITTPKNILMVKHGVKNFAKWLAAYEAHDSARLAGGLHSFVVGRGLMDSNMVMVVMKVDDTARANAFSKDPSLKTVMQNAGVVGKVDAKMITMEWQDTGMVSSPLRSVVSYAVKDWNTWFQKFQAGDQVRMENGLTVRGVGHDAADQNKIRVVTALVDSAKAMMFFKSDMLKKRMEEFGKTGDAERFFFRVVKRY